jgi:hypothetical protein
MFYRQFVKSPGVAKAPLKRQLIELQFNNLNEAV